MKVRATSGDPARTAADVLAVPLFALDAKKPKLPTRLSKLDAALGGRLGAVVSTGDFRGRTGESLAVYPDGDVAATRVLLVGLGDEAKADEDVLRRAAGTCVGATASRRSSKLVVLAPHTRRVRPPAAARALSEGALLAGYRFEGWKEKSPDEPKGVTDVTFLYDKPEDARNVRRSVTEGTAIAESQNLARELSNLPPNALPPANLAKEAQKMSKDVGLRCRVFGPAELKRRNMGAILAVGGGSANPPRMVVMEHGTRRARNARRGKPTLCLVGKGVTFDSGGISIKPSAAMDEMKHDMSGAAAVVGAMRAVALLKLPLHVVGIVGAAENMPSGTAYRPGDLVRSASGKVIEVLNTDAEGRLVLADALHFATTEYEPDAIVDLATLTGAVVIALGSWCSGAYGSDDALLERLRKAGEATAERVWPMPLWQGHKDAIKSRVGDLKNTGGREAGSATAAAFLSAFVGDTSWAHLDIAGTAWTGKTGPYQRPGATGVGVRLLVELLQNWRKA
jgi:leucyl aminopeptidase